MTYSQTFPADRRITPLPSLTSGIDASIGGARRIGMVFAETRPGVQFVFLSRVLCFAAVAGGNPFAMDYRAIGAIVGWVFLSMAVYVLNGVSDIAGDRANSSRRPIAAGRLPVATAVSATGVLALAGLALCALHSGELVLLGLAVLWLGAGYSVGRTPLKSTTVGFAVAVGGGALLSYGAGAVIGGGAAPGAYALALGMALWVGLSSATKDFSDVAGDRLAGRSTWPVRFGDTAARRLVAALSTGVGLGLGLLSILLLDSVPSLALPGLVGAVGGVSLAWVVLRTADRPRSRCAYRVFMSVQYLVNGGLLVGAIA